MSDVAFGTALQTVTDVAAFARRAEDLGFDILGCGEHVMFHGPVGNTFISLSVAAGATQRIKLLSSIVLLPLYPRCFGRQTGSRPGRGVERQIQLRGGRWRRVSQGVRGLRRAGQPAGRPNQ